MHTSAFYPNLVPWFLGVIVLGFLLTNPLAGNAKEMKQNNPLNRPPDVYWCPNRTADQQIAATPEPGCIPLVDKEQYLQRQRKAGRIQGNDQPPELFEIQRIQDEASGFIRQYRAFLDCCTTDAGAIPQIIQLEADADQVLMSVQQKGLFNSSGFGTGPGNTAGGGPGDGTGSGGVGAGTSDQKAKLGTFARQWTLSEIVGSVVRARNELGNLKQRLEQLNKRKENLGRGKTYDYETSGRETRSIQQEEEAITREFRSKKPPASAKTGGEISNSTLKPRVGGEIEDTTLSNTYGADIGYTVSPYSQVEESLKPRRGTDIQDTNTPTRIGPATQDTTLPNSFGFDINKKENPEGSSTTPSRVGPNIGDSSLNEQR